MLRITGGNFKGRKLLSPKGKGTRPTLEKTREAIFNILNSRYELSNYSSYDLFAGSGALGFEAFSRGSNDVIFLDNNKQNCHFITQNIKQLALKKHCSVLFRDAVGWMKSYDWKKTPALFLLDPPYNTDLAQQIIDLLKLRRDILTGSLIVIETDKNHQLSYPPEFVIFQQKVYGKTRLDFIEI